jgi:hypothetical protein
MKAAMEVKFTRGPLTRLTERTAKRAKLLMDKAAFDVAANAVRKVRVDTGATKASIYVEGVKGSNSRTYDVTRAKSAQIAAASGRRPNMWYTEMVSANGEWERIVGASTWYAEFVEYIHEHFLIPALLETFAKTKIIWGELFK